MSYRLRRASRSLSVVLGSLAAGLVLAATAGAAPTSAPQHLTGGQPLPAAERGYAESLTGNNGLKTVPKGWTILSWNFTLAAGASADLPMTCPTGTAIADLGMGLPNQAGAANFTFTPNDFVPFYGTHAQQLTATASTGQPASVALTVVCLPLVTAKTTIVHGHSPVTFPTSDIAVGLKKGAVIPPSWRLYKSVIGGAVSRNGAVGLIGHQCPGETQENGYVISRPGKGGVGLPNNAFALAPSPKLGKSPVTVYTLCSSLIT